MKGHREPGRKETVSKETGGETTGAMSDPLNRLGGRAAGRDTTATDKSA